jgi:uncharacterized protein GlcG (DUF336 family)
MSAELTLDYAESLVDAALAHATVIDVPSTVTVIDAGGHVVLAKRQDSAALASIDSSAAKAKTALFFKAPTEALVGAVQPGAPLYTMASAGSPLVFIAGGVPLTDSAGAVIGAIGAAGGSPEQDAEVVKAAL